MAPQATFNRIRCSTDYPTLRAFR